MPTKTVEIGDDGTVDTIWSNPDLPAVDDIAEADGKVELKCPGEDCEGRPGDIEFDDDPEDYYEFVDFLEEKNDGTFRCGECDEPLYGRYGRGDGEGDLSTSDLAKVVMYDDSTFD